MINHCFSFFQADQAGFDQRMQYSFAVLSCFRLFGFVDESESIAEDVLRVLLNLDVCAAAGCKQVLQFALLEVRVFLLPVESLVEVMEDLAFILDAFDYLLELVGDLVFVGQSLLLSRVLEAL